ncbi:hypothetical protein MHH85_14450 [Viridibacillus sp. FSL E2-0187]|uniref:hypothetical protein n=1 Tax=Viridibacillus TaxID=496496 RepID=UPI00187B75C5|nr:hypothetical protein [Viridibacillus sp. JNUCC-6]QOV10956.1 hypothetical protein JNUCC6_20705 [Viridibacillus sp. JNUCC-6]
MKKSMLSIAALLVLSLSFGASANATPPSNGWEGGGGSVKPPKCNNQGQCPIA